VPHRLFERRVLARQLRRQYGRPAKCLLPRHGGVWRGAIAEL
jgi:hypothetical protein